MISARSTSPTRRLAIRAALAVCGSLLLAASAQVAVPMAPVSITLQTLAIPLVVLALGRNLGTISVLMYLAEGATGLPVFTNHLGAVSLVGPTAGYLWSYPIVAYVTGLLLDRGLDRTYATRWLAIFLGTSSAFAGGVWWLCVGAHLSPAQAVVAGVAPFLIGDFLKVTIAAGMPAQSARLFARLGA